MASTVKSEQASEQVVSNQHNKSDSQKTKIVYNSIEMNTVIALILLFAAARGAQLNVNELLPEVHDDKFYYFGFGSNMLAKRIHIQNPTAQLVGPATLADYRLDFATISNRWNGAVATIVPTANALTWGALWDIELTNLADIDEWAAQRKLACNN